MKISKRGEYACLALIHLCRNKDKSTRTKDISEAMDIPKKYLEQILIQLKTSGYVVSIRGSQGGYRLAKSPNEINVAEIIRLIDGPIASVSSVSEFYYSESPIEKEKKLHGVLREIRDYISSRLESLTFEELI